VLSAADGHDRHPPGSTLQVIPNTRKGGKIATIPLAPRTARAIAHRLVITVATVKNHVHNILGKLDVRTRADAPRSRCG
jgi:hypothetical protein